MKTIQIIRQDAESIIDLIEKHEAQNLDLMEHAAYLREQFGISPRPTINTITEHPATAVEGGNHILFTAEGGTPWEFTFLLRAGEEWSELRPSVHQMVTSGFRRHLTDPRAEVQIVPAQ